MRDSQNQGWLSRLGGDVVYAAVVDLTGKALVYLGIVFLAALGLLIWQGGSVPAWLLLIPIALAALLAVFIVRRLRAKQVDNDSLIKELGRSGEYSRHLQISLDDLQRVISGDVDVDIPNYLEQGVLEPARRILTEKPAEDVRLSVLLPSAGAPDRWSMPWAAGHSLTGKSKYDQPIADTLARHAYESGAPQSWGDTEGQTEFRQNPLASAPTRSMVSIPIREGDDILGVFDAVSSDKDAFDKTEQTFLASLAGVIAVAVSVSRNQVS